jgi:hypothetical protein
MTDTMTTADATITITPGLPETDEDVTYIAVPATTRKRGKYAVRRSIMTWPKGAKLTLREVLDDIIEHWED